MRNVFRRVALVTAVLPLVVGGCATHRSAMAEPDSAASQSTGVVPHPARSAAQLPPPSELETRHGIQITKIGLTAAGGLVDFRFKVLDAQKARRLLSHPANMPMLIAGDNPPLMPPHHALKGAKFGEGAIYFILYPNVRSAIKPGVEATVAMGDVRLGPVTVQ